MAVTPYQSQESKKSQVGRMFDRIAPFYDFLNHFLSLGIDIWWRKKAVNHLKSLSPKYILDVATGTADLSIEAAQTLLPTKIIGVDISQKMLDVGAKKIIEKNLTNVISLEKGDSEHLRFETDTFDAVMAAFGVRNFENLQKGLSEMYRVLKPGGQIMILEFSQPKGFPLKQLFNVYFKNILPVIGKIKSKDKDAYKYLYESVQQFPSYEAFTKELSTVGFKQSGFKSLTGGICAIYFAIK
ncbi:MAG: bifunctional demethylmenaquinone methyltransferase/2-methoxy-6-polyprenyl-1,4-benzoquinol methylase UbiE [Saprospiraceae bacterium]